MLLQYVIAQTPLFLSLCCSPNINLSMFTKLRIPESDETQTTNPTARPQHHKTNTLKQLTFGILPLKYQASAAAGTLFNLNNHWGTMFPSQPKRHTFNGTAFPIHLLQIEGILIL